MGHGLTPYLHLTRIEDRGLETAMMKRTVLTLLAAVAVAAPVAVAAAVFTPAAAQVSFNVLIGTPPPAPVYEVVPAPRVGYVWAPGFWRWEHERHVWAPGHWIPARAGNHWVPDHWVRVDGPRGGWRHDPGHWNHD